MAQVHEYEDPVREPFKGQFGRMRFEPYKFREYPKVIGKDAHGRDVVAQSQREELEYIAKGEVTAAAAQSVEADRNLAVALAAEAQRELELERAKRQELEARLAALEVKAAAPGALDLEFVAKPKGK